MVARSIKDRMTRRCSSARERSFMSKLCNTKLILKQELFSPYGSRASARPVLKLRCRMITFGADGRRIAQSKIALANHRILVRPDDPRGGTSLARPVAGQSCAWQSAGRSSGGELRHFQLLSHLSPQELRQLA